MTETDIVLVLEHGPQLPGYEHAGAEPCLRELIFRYYRNHFLEDKSYELTESYIDHLIEGLAVPRYPDGLYVVDGVLVFDCRVCESQTVWEGEPELFDYNDPHNLCGGSPRCCP